MKRHRLVPFALFATLALAWSLPAYATAICSNGKTLYNKTNAVEYRSLVRTAAATAANVNKNNIQNAASNPGLIDQALDGHRATRDDADLRGNAGADVLRHRRHRHVDLLLRRRCPVGRRRFCRRRPRRFRFGSTTVGSTSATTPVTVTNAGTATRRPSPRPAATRREFPSAAIPAPGRHAQRRHLQLQCRVQADGGGRAQREFTVNRTGGAGITSASSGTGYVRRDAGPVVDAGVDQLRQPERRHDQCRQQRHDHQYRRLRGHRFRRHEQQRFRVRHRQQYLLDRQPGPSCSVGVTFKPSAAGARSRDDHRDEQRHRQPADDQRQRHGHLGRPHPGQLSMTNRQLRKPDRGHDERGEHVTVTNIGGTAVSVSSVSSNNPSEFAIASSTCATVNAGASCSFSFTFKPGTPACAPPRSPSSATAPAVRRRSTRAAPASPARAARRQ